MTALQQAKQWAQKECQGYSSYLQDAKKEAWIAKNNYENCPQALDCVYEGQCQYS